MRVLVTGGSSLPGFRVVSEALRRGYEVVALYNRNPIPLEDPNLTKVRLDITNLQELERLLLESRPDAIVHVAALGDVDECERNKELAWKTNVAPTVLLSRYAARRSVFLEYLSTDFVFDGERGGYRELDTPNPVNYYGLTKLAGELACAPVGSVVRASSIYGFGPGRKNFAKLLLEKLGRGEPLKALVDQYTSPTQATLLARAMVEILERGLFGVFHVVGERMSRYEFALRVARALGLDESLVQRGYMEEMRWFAKRPRDSSLNAEATRKALKTEFFSTEKAMEVLKEEYRAEEVGGG